MRFSSGIPDWQRSRPDCTHRHKVAQAVPWQIDCGKPIASFVAGDPAGTDGFGHGTHVAGIIAGAPVAAEGATPAFAGGIAPGAHLVNVRVLSSAGVGYTSDVIAGIDWAIAYRAQYNIRVINLSLGHPVVEPAEGSSHRETLHSHSPSVH